MTFAYPHAHIAIFAREPRPGGVKTRLQPALGETGCLSLYRAMLRRTVETVAAAELAPHSLWVSSNPSHETFITLCHSDIIYNQEGGDLGVRMAHASATLLAGKTVRAVLIVGTDCPALDRDYLGWALGAMAAGTDVVLGPAEDGGYVLIGLRSPQPALFRGIDWGSARVLEQTVATLRAMGLRYTLLETLWDVDRPQDLPRLETLVPPLDFAG